ncbi:MULTISPECIES: hypothetical protein [unclassified Acinetobacter]|uniref:hypothetical protein n=1 Tax=unclassified Acinetobacter TaxID=196816 RepID=UPI0035BAC9CA
MSHAKKVMSILLMSAWFMGHAWAETASTPVSAATPTATAPVAVAPSANPPLIQNVPVNPHDANAKAPVLSNAQLIAKHKQELDAQQQRLTALEQANQLALSQNQALQLKNDNLGVQIQVLQSERSSQMFIYGAVTIAVGGLVGFLIGMFIFTRNQRRRF